MSVESNTYLRSISLQELTNWSVRYLLDFSFNYNEAYELVPIGEFLIRNKNLINIQDDVIYQRVRVKINNNGVYLRDTEIGKNIGTKKQYTVNSGQFIISKIDARNGAMGLIPDKLEGAIVTNDFPTFIVDNNRINSQYLLLLTTTKIFISFAQSCSSGTTNRQRINIEQFLNIKIPLPSLEEQRKIVANYNFKIQLAKQEEEQANQLEIEIENYLFEVLGIDKYNKQNKSQGINIIHFKNIEVWGADKILRGSFNQVLKSKKYPNKKLGTLVFVNPRTDLSNLKDDTSMSFIPMKNVSDDYGEILKKDAGLKSKSKGYTKFQNEDLIWARITPCMQNGKSAIVNNLENGLGYGSTEYHVLRKKESFFLLSYLYHLLRSQAVLNEAVNHFTGSSGQQRVPKSYLENLIVPLPPITIQEEISIHLSDLKNQLKDLDCLANQNRVVAIKEFEQEIYTTA